MAFDLPAFAGCGLRAEPWEQRRDGLELLARALVAPVELSPLVTPSRQLTDVILAGDLGALPRSFA